MPELLSPAGNFEKMKAAIRYGADAVYLAGKRFGMRAAADNFTDEELLTAVEYAHSHGVRIYVALNIMPHTSEYPALEEYVQYLSAIGIDAVIVADIGVLMLVKSVAPSMEIHISTQASAVSADACIAWYRLGARRVVLARELTLAEIKEIRAAVPKDLELEAFIHGSMCISYSGRCLLSQHFTGRDANRGMCTQPCRWNYHIKSTVYEVVEEKRPELPIPLIEENGETFMMAAKDMWMIEHIRELMESGIDSFKIEGRMKSLYYAAVTANTYRMAIDRYMSDPEHYALDPLWLRELCGVSHREYDTGFYFTDPKTDAKTASNNGYLKENAFLATVISYDKAKKRARCFQRNKMLLSQDVELLIPHKTGLPFKVSGLADLDGNPIESTPHPEMEFYMDMPYEASEGDIIRGV